MIDAAAYEFAEVVTLNFRITLVLILITF